MRNASTLVKTYNMKKQNIQVRNYNGAHHSSRTVTPEIIGSISRKVYAIACGNFCPVYCRYLGKTYLVHSESGDLSDPFRAEESYLKTLFIDISKPCAFSI